jgi:hypothetical protein
MARATGMSQTAISRIWRAYGLKPHLRETWSCRPTRSSSTRSATSSGFTWNRPRRRWCCVDEKSQIQALDRNAPSLSTTPARRSHDYVRHGTTSLFAALDVASGTVISSLHRRHPTRSSSSSSAGSTPTCKPSWMCT